MFDEIVKRYRPRGWRVRVVNKLPKHSELQWPVEGETDWQRRVIRVKRSGEVDMIQTFLHEAGHVTLRHDKMNEAAREEYEAERFAFAAMRVQGIRVPRRLIREAKDYVQQFVEREKDVDAEILKWVYGRTWKDHR